MKYKVIITLDSGSITDVWALSEIISKYLSCLFKVHTVVSEPEATKPDKAEDLPF